MVFEFIPLITAFVGTLLAAIWDLKTTEVPDQLPFVMIAIALLFYGYQSIVDWNYWPILNSLIFGLSFLAFGTIMYFIGQWGGADGLILSAVGFLLPYVPQGFTQTIFSFPVSYAINLFIVGAIYMLGFALIYSLMNRKIFSGFVTDLKANTNILLISSVGLLILFYIAGLKISKVLYDSLDFVKAFYISLYPLFAVVILYLVWRFAKSIENYGFKKKIPVSKLKVGDMLLKERKLIGITEEQLKEIKKSGKKFVEIKEGVRFAPAFVIALLITLFYGDAILLFMGFLI